eukprot:2989653-Alexandrium_andersonii.AAC.1
MVDSNITMPAAWALQATSLRDSMPLPSSAVNASLVDTFVRDVGLWVPAAVPEYWAGGVSMP